MNSRQHKELLKMKRFNKKYRSWRPGKFGKFFHKYLLPVTVYNLEIRNILVTYKEKHDIFYAHKLALKERLKKERERLKQERRKKEREERERLKQERRKNSLYGNYYNKNNNINNYGLLSNKFT
jgi:regulator of protease activity HflC (stomatin/prohibitin superfamily)